MASVPEAWDIEHMWGEEAALSPTSKETKAKYLYLGLSEM